MSNNSKYDLQGLFKAYPDYENKHNGEPFKNISRKKTLLLERCQRNDKDRERQLHAFSIILHGHDLQNFLDNLNGSQ